MDWQLLSAQLLNGLVLGSIYALIALGYTMVWNILEFINFAHGEVYMIGAFVGLTTVMAGAPLIVGFVAGAAAAALLGVLIERLAYRPLRGTPKINLLISAIGVSIILQNLAQVIWGARPKVFPSSLLDASFQIAGININYQQIFIIGTALLLMVGLQLWIKHSMMGKALRGSAQDMEAAQLMGIPTNRIVSLTFAVGSALGAIGRHPDRSALPGLPHHGLPCRSQGFYCSRPGRNWQYCRCNGRWSLAGHYRKSGCRLRFVRLPRRDCFRRFDPGVAVQTLGVVGPSHQGESVALSHATPHPQTGTLFQHFPRHTAASRFAAGCEESLRPLCHRVDPHVHHPDGGVEPAGRAYRPNLPVPGRLLGFGSVFFGDPHRKDGHLRVDSPASGRLVCRGFRPPDRPGDPTGGGRLSGIGHAGVW